MKEFTNEISDTTPAAIKGENKAEAKFGVWGVCATGHGVHGDSTTNHGVHGESVGGRGVVGNSQTFFGVSGSSASGIGVSGESASNVGVLGKSPHSFGVQGVSETNHGVHGDSVSGRGVQGKSQTFFGVSGSSESGIGVGGESTNGIGVFGKGGALAGRFEGQVEITGNVLVGGDINLPNADCAEDFDIDESTVVEPGTVMVLNHVGALTPSAHAYDRRVAGVVSGAGTYKPGIVLDRRQTPGNRQPIALLGKVYCKVDATYGAIEVGDLLTSSPTPGHAMRADEPLKAFGSVIGKALRPLRDGQALVPILIALQ